MRLTSLLVILACLCGSGRAQGKKKAEYFFAEGEKALEENKYTTALAHFNECLRLDPYFLEAYQSRASARQKLGDTKGALTDYSIYLESRPAQPEALLSRATLRYDLGQYVTAREDFQTLLTLPAGVTNTVFFRQGGAGEGTDKIFTLQGTNHAVIFNYLGLINTRLKNYPQAAVFFDSALRLEPHDPHYLINRGVLKEHQIDTAGAIADYQKALSIDPAFGLAIHNLAVIKRTRGQQTESEKMLDDAIQQSPNLPYPYAARAYYRLHHKDLRGAIDDYDRVILLNKTDEESWMYRGMVKEKLKDFDGAFIDYTEAISLKNDFARAWLARGTLLTKLNRLPEAVEDYSVAITWYPEFGLAFYNRAIAQQKLGKLKEACEDLNTAEKMNVRIEVGVREKTCL